MATPIKSATGQRRAPIAPIVLMQLEQMRHQAEDNLHRAEERAVRYQLQLDALKEAIERLGGAR